MAPNHGPIAQHGSYNAQICPTHELWFGTPVISGYVGYLVKEFLGFCDLVVDMLGINAMQALGVPVTIDATHAVQLPGADPRTAGASTGGRREGVSVIAKSAIAARADGVFLEFHTNPDAALCDAPSCLPISGAADLLKTLKQVHEAVA